MLSTAQLIELQSSFKLPMLERSVHRLGKYRAELAKFKK